MTLETLFDLPRRADPVLQRQVQHRIDHLTKPLGALGRLEALALQVALLQGRSHPALEAPQMLVCAADHGLAVHGVSAYPAEVTAQMVANFLAGGAAVSVLARRAGLALTVADCGVRGRFAPQPGYVDLKTGLGLEAGTADMLQGPAMSAVQCEAALRAGADLVDRLPGNVLLLGEMGIGNTSAAALLMARLTGRPVAECTGRGTGLDDAGLARKRAVLEAVAARHADAHTPLQWLAAMGGAELAVMAGATLQAARTRRLVVVDGFICSAAVAVAAALAPAVLDDCVFAHCSQERGHRLLLEHLGVRPLLDLDLRLGEGSGAALAWPLLDAACALLQEMASFESAGVSQAA
jgi:nicotinate-nucleotide--dimethylbenzimidazole phosphoribosyltransferase